jgi:hypothetical protein
MTWLSARFENNNGLLILVLIDKLNLMAYRRPGQSVRGLIGWTGVMLTCLSRHVLGLNGSRRLIRRWLWFDVIQDCLNDVWVRDVWVSDVDDDTQGTAVATAVQARSILCCHRHC